MLIWSMHDGSSTVLTINDPDSLNNDAGLASVAISPDVHSAAGTNRSVKSKEGAAAAAASVSSSGAGSSIGRKDEKASLCMMNFTGHKVCNFFFLFSCFPSS